jgi:hypothetical protein
MPRAIASAGKSTAWAARVSEAPSSKRGAARRAGGVHLAGQAQLRQQVVLSNWPDWASWRSGRRRLRRRSAD